MYVNYDFSKPKFEFALDYQSGWIFQPRKQTRGQLTQEIKGFIRWLYNDRHKEKIVEDVIRTTIIVSRN